jgi:hypothetical protein
MTDEIDIYGKDLEAGHLILEEGTDCYEELQRMKAELLGAASEKTNKAANSNADPSEDLEGPKTEPQKSPSHALTIIEEFRLKSTIDSLQGALEISILELREAVKTIASVQYNLVGQCQQSKAKAVESHKEAQASLLDHNMTGVFLHSTNKTAHIKIVQILREQAGHAESRASSLRKSLANLERLKTQFQTQAKLVNFQASNPSSQQVVQPPSDHLDDHELVNLKKQLDDL